VAPLLHEVVGLVVPAGAANRVVRVDFGAAPDPSEVVAGGEQSLVDVRLGRVPRLKARLVRRIPGGSPRMTNKLKKMEAKNMKRFPRPTNRSARQKQGALGQVGAHGSSRGV